MNAFVIKSRNKSVEFRVVNAVCFFAGESAERDVDGVVSNCNKLLEELKCLLIPFTGNDNLLSKSLIDPGQIVSFEELEYYCD